MSLFEGETRGGPTHRAVEIAPATITSEVHELARQLPKGIRLGTSSWHFPGWRGMVWADTVPPGDLSRHGLAAYAQHPLFTTVSVDRSFYAPLSAWQYAVYARQVPEHFRFVVKAPSALTMPWTHTEPSEKNTSNAHFLDAACAIDQFVGPVMEGLGAKAGALLFQFPPLGRALTRAPERFIAQLQEFLGRLPQGPLYAVEMRDDRMITRRFFSSLHEVRARYCLGVHPRMPPVATQAAAMAGVGPGPLIVRWNLRAGYGYEDARTRFTPFDQLVDEDSATRLSIAQLCAGTLAAGQECTIIVNNKAEGSAPLTLLKLAQAIISVARQRRQAAEV